MLQYNIKAKRIDNHGSLVQCKEAEIILDTDLQGRSDAFNPAELLLAALAACIIKNIERIVPIIHFELDNVQISITGYRQDKPPKMQRIEYKLVIDTLENDKKLALLHRNIKQYGTVYNTLALGCELTGTIERQ